MGEWEKEAHEIAKAVRSCTTDEQYTKLVEAITDHLIDAYKLGFLAGCDGTRIAVKRMLTEPFIQDDTP